MMEPPNTGNYHERRLQVTPDLSMFYRVYDGGGEGVPVVCLHGYWRTSKDYEEFAGHLVPNRKVVVPDLRGRGQSDCSANPSDYEFEHLAEDVRKLLVEEGVSRAVFVGVALGAQLAMDIAVRSPDTVAGIVFNDTAPESVAASGKRQSAFSGGDELDRDAAMARITAQYGDDFPRMRQADYDRMLYRNYRQTERGTFVRDFDQATNEALYKTMREHPTFWPIYEQIGDIPITVLRGANSDFITPEIVDRMLAGRTAAVLQTIPECGHPALMWEAEVFAAVDAMLARIDASSL